MGDEALGGVVGLGDQLDRSLSHDGEVVWVIAGVGLASVHD